LKDFLKYKIKVANKHEENSRKQQTHKNTNKIETLKFLNSLINCELSCTAYIFESFAHAKSRLEPKDLFRKAVAV